MDMNGSAINVNTVANPLNFIAGNPDNPDNPDSPGCLGSPDNPDNPDNP